MAGAGLSSNDIEVSIKKASTWGTAVALSSALKLRASSLTPGGGFEELRSDNIGFGKRDDDTRRGLANFTMGVGADYEFDQAIHAIMAQVMGTEASATEQTVGEGDYLHVLDLGTSIYGNFFSMGSSVETSVEILEYPSVKFNQFTLEGGVNGKVLFSAQALVDRIVTESWTSSFANVTGNTDVASEIAVFGGADVYCRINPQSGGSLSGSDDMEIESWKLTVNRPLTPQHGLRGAQSAYILEPKDTGRIDVQLDLTFTEASKAKHDNLGWWNNQTELKAELYFSGSPIGVLDRSVKIQIPKMYALPAFPGGFNIPNNNSLMKPSQSFRCCKVTAAPTGMSGVTDLRLSIIDEHTTKWFV